MSDPEKPPAPELPPTLPPVLRRSNVFIISTRDLVWLVLVAVVAGVLIGRGLP